MDELTGARQVTERGTRMAWLAFALPLVVLMGALALDLATSDGRATSLDSTRPASAVQAPETPVTLPARLTPKVEDLPRLAPTAELESRASAVPTDQRRLFGTDDNGRVLGWTEPASARGTNVFPVFNFDGSLAGIFVSNLGLVSREDYERPGFDPEPLAQQRLSELAADE